MLVRCTRCARHVRDGVLRCPFCGDRGRLEGPVPRLVSRRELTRAAIVTGGALLAAACGGADRREPIRETQTSGGDCETPGGCGGHDGGEEANRDAPPPDPRSPEEIARQRREAEAAMEREREAERRAREAYRREREDEERLRREQLRREQEDDSCCPPYGAPPLVVELV